MARWWVFYADWQMECCGTPFSVDDEVSWPLLLLSSDEVLGGGWYEELSKLSGPVETVTDHDGDGGGNEDEEGGVVATLRGDDGLTAALSGEPPDEPGQWIRAVGMLTVERHGGLWPETAGTVRAIRVVRQEFAETDPGSRTLEPVPQSRSLETADSSPKWFGEGRCGVLAELEVPDLRT
ncbi:DUF6578 domain-containing protein [Streptomyces sp. NPDC005813]|uniref:DUF6578 domain-containing protein n=1 Tax=Streptomyces sp. NPDC005813 TaxID=3155592 RepID=UPI0033CB7216